MKIKLQTMLKNKLQWLLLLAALLGVSQGVWAGADTNGESLIVLSSENSTKRYTITSASWSVGCTSNLPTSGGNLSGQTFTVSSYDLVLKGAILGGWANGGNWMCGELQYKIYTGTEPGWSNYKVGNYDTGSGSADVMCTSGDNVYVGQKDGNVSLTEGKDPGSYTLKAQLFPRTRWNSGSNSYTYGVQGPVTATVNIDAYVYINSGWSKMTKSGSSYYYSVGSSGKTFRISNKQKYDTTFENNYSVGTSTGVTVTKSSNTYTATINSGYDASTLKIWIDPSTHKVYATADPTCSQPEMAQPTKKNDRVNGIVMYVKATSLGDCAISKWGLKAWTSSACSGDAAFTTAIDNDDTPLTTSNQEVTISELTSNTTYYFKSYVELDDETIILSDSYTQRTTRIEVSANDATGISSTAATISGSTTSGGSAVTTLNSAAGFIYSTNKSDIDTPNVSEGHATFVSYGSVTSVGSNFSYTFSGLSPNNTYYYKAMIVYTTNGSELTAYSGTTKSFTTNNVFGIVSIDNNGVSSVCLGSGTVTWNASASSGNPTSWTVSSSNTTVATATINSSGVITITPKAAGSTTITATAKRAGYDDKTSDGVTITVNAVPTITLTGVGGKSTSATYPWDYMTITATTTPADLVVNWTKLYSGSGSEPVNSVTESAPPSHTYKIKSAITSNPNSDKYTIKANGTKSGCAATEAVYDVYINNPDGEICD